MLQRSVLGLSSRRLLKRLPRHFTAQLRSFSVPSRKGFSSTPGRNGLPKPDPTGKPDETKGNASKVLLGSAVVAGAFLVAYQAGYMDQYLGKGKGQQKLSEKANFDVNAIEGNNAHHLGEQTVSSNVEEPDRLSPSLGYKVETQAENPRSEASSEMQKETEGQDKSDLTLEERPFPSKPNEMPQESALDIEERSLPQNSNRSVASDDQSKISETSIISSEVESVESEAMTEPTENAISTAQSHSAHEESEPISGLPLHPSIEEAPKNAVSQDKERPASLLEEYYLKDNDGESSMTLSSTEHVMKEAEALINEIEELNDVYLTKDGKLVLDFLAAIHAAEERQAELDARFFAKEKRALEERYENELKDLKVRELMRTEEAAMLDKELKRERAKAAAAIKAIQEKMEEKLQTELEQKEAEAEMKLKKVEELAKAELASAIAKEKAAQIEKMAEADLNIKALCMAFYARSEEARKSHSVHKLALGALALEDVLSKGLPIQKEIDALQTYLESIQKDSILDLVLSSLPEETRYHGTDSLLQLSQKFNTLKGTLRHFSLIPPGGGGILAHSLAHIASWLKVKEVDQSGEGIESVIKRVDNYLAEGKLAEAAVALEEGVKGSQAEEIVSDWVKRARNRAITEQALTLLQSYATCVSLT